MLDPTDAAGGVAVRGFAEAANDVGGERGAYADASSLFGKNETPNEGNVKETRIVPPTVSLFVPHGLREVWRSLFLPKDARGFRVVPLKVHAALRQCNPRSPRALAAPGSPRSPRTPQP